MRTGLTSLFCALLVLGTASVAAAPNRARPATPRCGPNEFLYWVLVNRDDGDRLHIEVTPLKGGEVESFDVAKPGHSLYQKHYHKGALVCRSMPLPPAGG